ncbi:MAG: GNAT family N-acetyltransferase [Rhodospirillaceae bacterium]|nr:GNAT family N-acetyltransferase [Rhodospirillaceae bacterium]
MSHIEIRLAERSDLQALRALQARSIRVLGHGYYTAIQIETFISRVGTMDDYLVADRTYLLATCDGEMVGCGGWTTRMPGYARNLPDAHRYANRDRATVRSVFVEPLAARRGIGRRIMNAVEDRLRGEGFATVELGATVSGHAFYRTLGYQPLREMRIDLGGGVSFALTVMSKTLAANTGSRPPACVA